MSDELSKTGVFKKISLAFAVFLFHVLPFIYFSSAWDPFVLSKWIVLVSTVIALSIFAFFFQRHRFHKFKIGCFGILLCLLFVWAHGLIVGYSVARELSFLGVVFLICFYSKGFFRLPIFQNRVFGSMTLLAVVFLLLTELLYRPTRISGFPYFFGGVISLTDYLVSLLAIQVAILTSNTKTSPGSKVAWTIIGISAVLISLIHSRMGMLSLGIALSYLFFQRKLSKSFLVGLIAVLFIVGSYFSLSDLKIQSAEIRVIRLVNSLLMLNKYPLGIGFGEFERIYPANSFGWRVDPEVGVYNSVRSPHNVLLELLVEGGFPLLCVGVALGLLFWRKYFTLSVPRWVKIHFILCSPSFLFGFPLENAFSFAVFSVCLSQIRLRFHFTHLKLNRAYWQSAGVTVFFVAISLATIRLLSDYSSLFSTPGWTKELILKIEPENHFLRMSHSRTIAENEGVRAAIDFLKDASPSHSDNLATWIEIRRLSIVDGDVETCVEASYKIKTFLPKVATEFADNDCNFVE